MEATIGRQPIEPTRDREPGARAEVAFKDFAIIADVVDDTRGPIIGEAERFAKRHPAGQMADGRIRTLHAVHLGEVSICTDPSCDPARVTAIKGADAGEHVMQGLRKHQAMLST